MADRYAPALLLDVLAFWFVLGWLLTAAAVLFVGRLLVLMMVVGILGTLDQHHYVWAGFFAAATALAWVLLRRWHRRRVPREGRRLHAPTSLAWRNVEPAELATMCERRVGLQVVAAVPTTIAATPDLHCVLALAGDGLWVLEDESRLTDPRVGRVLACWATRGLVAHVERLGRRDRLELSWPANGALVRGVTLPSTMADVFAGHLVADEFSRRT